MTVKVVVTTYVPEDGHIRGKYLWKAVKSLRDNLYGGEPMEFIMAHDGPVDQVDVLKAGRDVLDWSKDTWWVTGGVRAGIGGSLNRALTAVVNNDLWLYTTDDWRLTDGYDLVQATQLIRTCGYDYVRLGPPHPNISCTTRFQVGVGWWLELHPECGGYTFATRPFLASKAFYEKVGPFKEQCDSYVCERDYADRVMALSGELKLAEVVVDSLEGPWSHIGEVGVGDTYP